MTGLILLLLAWLLILPATIVNVILVAIKARHRGWVKWVGGYFKRTAYNLDVFGADEFQTLWNTIIVTKEGEQFKADGHTISFYLGANQIQHTLTGFGKFVALICDIIDKDHCRKAYINELK